MQGSFYTNVTLRGKNILLRGVDKDGNRFKRELEFTPTLFVPSNKKSEYTTLDGTYVEPIPPGNINECRDFIKRYENVDGFEVFGNTDFIYQFMGDAFPEEIDYDVSKVKVAYIDIETESEYGFPRPDNPEERVNAITVDFGTSRYVLGLGKFKAEDGVCFDTEHDLLLHFLSIWERESPDVITGWNVRFFDIPYLINRIARVLGESECKKLSPWRQVKDRIIQKMGKENQVFDIVGISTLDYYELYRTFTYVNQESYRLDHIAFVELGEKKLSYDEFDSMSEFYKKNFQKFIDYNIHDVELIKKLEEKMKLLELALSLAYSAKVNYTDVFGQVRMWDCIIYQYLKSHNVIIPPKKPSNKGTQYAGAYVKEPITGMHDWVVSFDLNSLYPHLIMQYNISPETKIKTNDKDKFGIGVDNILKSSPEPYWSPCHDKLEDLKAKDFSIAANGTIYRRDRKGFLPSLMEKMYKERKLFKKKMIECQKELEELPKKDMPTLGRAAYTEKLQKEISKYHNFQLVRKIQLNSAYGAIGNEFFRYFDVDMAEGITLSGQLSIRWIALKLNEFLNKTIGTKEYDYVVASDTDSLYLRLGNRVDKVCRGKPKSEIVEFLDKASKEIILPFIKKQYDEVSQKMNAYENKMIMDRECISDKAVWTAKKRYMMRVHDSEGVRYETPKLKIMGIETTRSSTPQVVRDSLKEAINLILTTDEDTVIDFIDKFKTQFFKYTPEQIAFPRGVNGLFRYADKNCIYKKSTPIAVKGSLIYNHYVKESGLSKKHRKIMDGDKIKFLYLKKPNPLGGAFGLDQVISFPNDLPKEFGLMPYVDYEKHFEKAFLEPLKNILETVGWKTERVSTLEDLFG